MQTPPNLNDQHAWGGQRFEPVPSHSPAAISEQDHPTLIARDRQDAQAPTLPQGGMIASSSDNLFHPVSHVPSSYVFSLPTVPSNPRHHANNSSTAFNRPLPYHSPFSSYNNPTFTIPHHAYYNHPRISPITVPLGPPPPLPPRPPPIRPFTQPHSFPHMYNHPFPVHQFPQPAYHQNQPAYYQHQPAFPVQHQPTYHHSASPFFQNPPLYQNPALDQNPTLRIPSSPSPPSSPLSSSKTLPTVTHIPFLTSKHDFFPWDEAVSSLIRANGLIGHILDPLTYVDPTRPDIAPSPPPVLSISSTAREIEASNRWWARDNIAQHILLSRLGPIPRGLIPAANIVTRTALSIYEILLKRYGTSNFADCTELLSSLHNSVCSSGRIQDYVSKWRTGLSKLQSAHFVFSIKICVALFVRGLPSIPAFNTLRADLPRRIAAIAGDHDFGAFIDLTDTVLELDTIFRPSVQPPASCTCSLCYSCSSPSSSAYNTSRAFFPHLEERMQQLQVSWSPCCWSYGRYMLSAWGGYGRPS